MIQRKQSIWLLLAGVAGLLTYNLPLWKGTLLDGSIRRFMGPESLLLFALIIVASLLAFVTIFLYKNRKLQMRLTTFGFLLSIAVLILEYFRVENFKKPLILSEGFWQIGALLPLIMAVLFLMAHNGIRKDEKLVKSLDRLR